MNVKNLVYTVHTNQVEGHVKSVRITYTTGEYVNKNYKKDGYCYSFQLQWN